MWSSRNACAVGVRTVCASLTGRHAQASNAHVNRLCSILFQRWTCYGQAGGGRDATPRAARPTRRGGSERDRPVACHDPKGSCRTKRAIPQLPRRVGERLARGASDSPTPDLPVKSNNVLFHMVTVAAARTTLSFRSLQWMGNLVPRETANIPRGSTRQGFWIPAKAFLRRAFCPAALPG